TILDRTLLRAGETVHMKHVYRAQTPTGFRTGGALKGILILQHRGSDTAYELPLAVGADGIGESEWKAPADAPGGDYDIQVKTEGGMRYTHQSFRVDEYRLPTMRASVTGPKARLARPRRLPLDLYLAYLSGGGAGSAPVKLRTEYEALNDRPEGWDEWTFGGSAVREGTTPLDDEGEDSGGSDQVPASATLPLTLGKDGALRTEIDLPEIQDAMRARIEMDYEDANGETLTTGTSVPLYASAIRLGIRPDGWIQRSGNLQLKVVALDLDGRIVAGQPVEVQLFTREILSARRRLIGGFYAYDNNARVTKLAANCSGVTDAKGMVECTLEPGVSGEVLAMAITRDRDGNEARAVTSVYLTGDGDWWFGGDNGDRMDVIPEAPSYRSGETARFQVRMPFREATALVTVEREGVLSSFVTTLSGKDPVVEVKMDGSYAPDVFVSVLAVRGRVAGWKLWLTEFARKWHLPFAGDPSQPTALVDLAKPAFRLGFAQVKVGWEAHRLDVKVTPARETWRVRENAKVEVQVTGPGGVAPADAEIAFAAVDEALLALAPNDSWDLLEAMMEERPLSVLTSTAQMQVVGKRHYGRKALAAGGGGGGDLSSLARSDFRPLLLWRGRVPLDANGRATVSVPLADSLSSYKLVAIATAGEQGFGTGSATIRTVQDLGVYSGVPPLVRSGDQFDALFTLRNSTGKDLKVIATAEVSPALGALKPQIVTVPAGGATPVSWRVTAPEAASLRWTVTASAAKSAASDRVTVEQEIVPPVPEETWAASFLRLSPGLRVPLAPPAGALPGRGAIEVALTASPAPSLSGVADYMRAYPYGCFEQRLSKAIALEDADAWAKQMADLPAYLADNGLLRYWPGSRQPGSVALTAYALSITAEAGLPWPADAKNNLLDALRSVADGRLTDEGEAPADQRLLRLAAVAALARNGESNPAMAARVAMPLRDMPTASLADWLTILDRTKGIGPAPKAAAEAALRGRIVYEGTRLDLVDKANAPWWMMVSGDEMALKALIAVTGRPGWAQEAPRMMIGAALRQSRGHWDTTPANAWGTLAVRRFAAAYPGVPTGVTTVTLGGSSVERGWPAPAPIHFPLPAQQTSLLFAHPGAAQPWAFVSVKAAVPLTAASFSGYRIAREASFLVRKTPGAVSRGDVMKIRITVQAPVDRTWVVVEDPIPAGASIVSGGGQSSLLAEKAGGGEGGWPSYIERSHGVWRAYYGWLPSGRTSVEYVVRINTTGRFQLPPTHVEAMYSPEIRASLPNPVLDVAP
ncbi:MAG: alpha-2-macroglobulin family protein, partial [Allosphingosinicella sp.]